VRSAAPNLIQEAAIIADGRRFGSANVESSGVAFAMFD